MEVMALSQACLALKKRAEDENLTLLAYILEMAALEALHHETAVYQAGLPPSDSVVERKSKSAA